jgi:hypothetical protein
MDNFQKINNIFLHKKSVKPPAYQWQDLALRLIKELNIPQAKRSSVFKICRDNPKHFIEQCLNDTKELSKSGERWRYFFKLINQKKSN